MSKPYLYKLESDFEFQHPALGGVYFRNNWCTILNGTIIVREGYAWDGCSPKFDVLGLFTLGTPDGRLKHGLPITYWASLVHDVLSQFRQEIPINKSESIQVFSDMLKQSGFKLWRLYALGASVLGPQDFRGNNDKDCN